MQTPVTIDQIYTFVLSNFPGLKWQKTTRFDRDIVACKTKKGWLILFPSKFDDRYNNGEHIVICDYEEKNQGCGCPCNSWEDLKHCINRTSKNYNFIIPIEKQLSLEI